jgi:hypothetical protein
MEQIGDLFGGARFLDLVQGSCNVTAKTAIRIQSLPHTLFPPSRMNQTYSRGARGHYLR